MSPAREMQAIFADLSALTSSPGYVHALAEICYRDDFITFQDEVKTDDLQKMFRPDRLIRTEFNVLLGLWAQGPRNFEEPADTVLDAYVASSDALMEELHNTMTAPMFKRPPSSPEASSETNVGLAGEAMREPIFYGSESAYPFQYRDLAVGKYHADNPWLLDHCGFSIEQAQAVARAIALRLEEKTTHLFNRMKQTGRRPTSWLPCFEFSASEIAFRTGLPLAVVQAMVEAFTLKGQNTEFQAVGDFNAVSATPLIRSRGETLLLLQSYSLYQALYEGPFYWLMADAAYRPIASRHRGDFTESFATLRLTRVFGSQCTHQNVQLKRQKGEDPGEVDVLVVFADRLIIVQAKSKKLTLESRRGNETQLRKDFTEAIQESYDQAQKCAQAILERSCQLIGSDGKEIVLPFTPKEIFLVCLVADHYPALAFQARQFLRYEASPQVLAPFVMDVFLLDAITEMLETPLRFLSYCKARVANMDRIFASHELTVLGFHLQGNLWVDPSFQLVMLQEDIASDLDRAMSVRRENWPGPRTPKGLLTHLSGTMYEQLIAQIEREPDPSVLEIGFRLLELGEDTCRRIDTGLKSITSQTRIDRQVHDFTLGGPTGGITMHCNAEASPQAMERLRGHTLLRQYSVRAPMWIGLSVDCDGVLQFGGVVEEKWEYSEEMEQAAAQMSAPMDATRFDPPSKARHSNKVGRNDRCPCGSGKKYKKCCGQGR
jgi:hypothetical protein